MRCCEFNCDVFLCKRCFNGKQRSATTLVFPTTEEESDKEQDIESDVNDEEDIDPELEQTVEYAEENNDNLCGAKFSLNLWVEKRKEASVCENLKFFDTKVECKI